MPSDRRHATGRRGEEIAAAYLADQGYRVVRTNVRTRYGELDIVAWDGDTLAFVEVRTRHASPAGGFGTAAESVDDRKRRKLAKLAEAYLQTLPEPLPPCRIDVVAIELGPGGAVRQLELIRDAV